MRKITFLAGVLMAPGLVVAGPPHFDSDFMQAVEDNHKSLTSNLAIQNTESALTDAKLLEASFAEIEAQFVQAGDVPEGVALAGQARQLIAEVLKALAANDFQTAANASSALGRNCKECHQRYRQD